MNDEFKLSIVISVYNEEEVLELFRKELETHILKLDCLVEIIFVNDGSADRSPRILFEMAKSDPRVKVINLSKNFGHEAAMTAGIDHSTGHGIICMDADLQHPPSKLVEILKKHFEGFDIINMVRQKNEDTGFLKHLATTFLYFLLNLLSDAKFEKNASDFFFISRKVADILKQNVRERTRFLRGLIQTVGFKKTTLEYVAPRRAAGETAYSFIVLLTTAIKAIATCSNLPLRIGVLFGTLAGGLSLIVGIYSIAMKLSGYVVTGYTTIVVLISFLFAVQFFLTGIIGEYLGFVFTESKKRPIYIIEDEIHFDEN